MPTNCVRFFVIRDLVPVIEEGSKLVIEGYAHDYSVQYGRSWPLEKARSRTRWHSEICSRIRSVVILRSSSVLPDFVGELPFRSSAFIF